MTNAFNVGCDTSSSEAGGIVIAGRVGDRRSGGKRMSAYWTHGFAVVIGALISAACSSPALQLSRNAQAIGLRREMLAGTTFEHVVFVGANHSSRTLHIYLDGDGTPWGAWGPAADPTPRNPLVLRLMALDPAPSLYLGRPCYLGLSKTPPCSSRLWTSERYSEAVVSSMEAALRHFLEGSDVDRLVWIGYSGGGTLAVLLAPRFDRTTDLITIAANLDIDAWSDLHGYSRLVGSLNPARQGPLPSWIRQRHYAGGRDRVVPQEVTARGPIGRDTMIVIPTYDHTCCWETIWPVLLAGLERTSVSGQSR
jgi:hypothetical protein